MMNLLSKDMDIYDSIDIFQIINAHHSSWPSNHIRPKILVFYSSKNKSNFLMDLDPHWYFGRVVPPNYKTTLMGLMGPPNVGLGGYYFLTPLKNLENMIFYVFSLWEGELNPLMVHRGSLGPCIGTITTSEIWAPEPLLTILAFCDFKALESDKHYFLKTGYGIINVHVYRLQIHHSIKFIFNLCFSHCLITFYTQS